MAFMFGAMQVAKRIPFEDNPDYLLYARISYVSAQLLCLSIFYYCSMRIKRKNDLTVLKYVEPKSAMSQEPGELVTTTNRDYDLTEISKSMRGVMMGMVFVAGMHLYMGYTNPWVYAEGIIDGRAGLEEERERGLEGKDVLSFLLYLQYFFQSWATHDLLDLLSIYPLYGHLSPSQLESNSPFFPSFLPSSNLPQPPHLKVSSSSRFYQSRTLWNQSKLYFGSGESQPLGIWRDLSRLLLVYLVSIPFYLGLFFHYPKGVMQEIRREYIKGALGTSLKVESWRRGERDKVEKSGGSWDSREAF